MSGISKNLSHPRAAGPPTAAWRVIPWGAMSLMRRVAALGIFASGLMLVIFGIGIMSVSATPPPGAHKVVICHATGSGSNPYVLLNVDIAQSGYVEGGYAADAEDIIPPYAFGTFHYPGRNWTDQGRAVWLAGCQLTGSTSMSASPVGVAAAPSATEAPRAENGDAGAAEAIGIIVSTLGFLAMGLGLIAYRRRET